jgi:hypothetical protein
MKHHETALAMAGSQYVTFADPAFRLRRWRNWEATMQGCVVYCVVWSQNVSDLWWHLAHIKAMQPGLAKEICSRSPQLQILQKVSASLAVGQLPWIRLWKHRGWRGGHYGQCPPLPIHFLFDPARVAEVLIALDMLLMDFETHSCI